MIPGMISNNSAAHREAASEETEAAEELFLVRTANSSQYEVMDSPMPVNSRFLCFF